MIAFACKYCCISWLTQSFSVYFFHPTCDGQCCLLTKVSLYYFIIKDTGFRYSVTLSLEHVSFFEPLNYPALIVKQNLIKLFQNFYVLSYQINKTCRVYPAFTCRYPKKKRNTFLQNYELIPLSITAVLPLYIHDVIRSSKTYISNLLHT